MNTIALQFFSLKTRYRTLETLLRSISDSDRPVYLVENDGVSRIVREYKDISKG